MRSPGQSLARIVGKTAVPYVASRVNVVEAFSAPGPMVREMTAFGSVGTLFAIVTKLANASAQIEWQMWRKAASGKKEDRTQVTTHLALNILNKPNEFFTRQELVEVGQQHMELTGETWWVISRNPRSRLPLEIWPVRPDKMMPVPSADDFISGYIYTGPDGTQVPLDRDQVIMMRAPNPLDMYRGMGPVQTIMPDLNASNMAAQYVAAFFTNSAEPGGIIEVDKRLGDDEFDEMTTRWREQHQGVSNAHRVAVIEQGHWIDRKYTMRDMQFAELRSVTSELIREAFGFPKPMLGSVDDVNRCHDDETEILTHSGWVPFPKLTDDDLVATVDPQTQTVEYHRPVHRFEYDYSGDMVRIRNRMVDVKVTPNHTMLFNTDRKSDWRTCRADELGSRVNFLTTVVPTPGDETNTFHLPAVEYANGHTGRGDSQILDMDPWLAFLGWVIAEGGILSEEKAGGRYVLTLAQKAQENVDHIRACLAGLPFASHEYGGQKDGCTRWNLAGKPLVTWLREHVGTNCLDKRIPRWCFDLSARQRGVVFDALMRGDGSWDAREGRTSGYYATQSEGLADDVLELAFSLGFRANMARHTDHRREHPMYYVHISPRKSAKVVRGDITSEAYVGKVYSVEVPNHVYVTRRNGRVAVHGNSNAEAAEYVFAKWLLVPRLERIKHALNNDYLKLFYPAGSTPDVEFDYVDPVPENKELEQAERLNKAQAAQIYIDLGFSPKAVLDMLDVPAMPYTKPAAPVAPVPAKPADVPVPPDAPPPGVKNRSTRHRAWPTDAQALPADQHPDLTPVQESWQRHLDVLLLAWAGISAAQARSLVASIRDIVSSGTVMDLTHLSVDSSDAAAALLQSMLITGAEAAGHAVEEVVRQGGRASAVPPPAHALSAYAVTVAALLAEGLTYSAAHEAARIWNPSSTPDDVATRIEEYLDSLSQAQPKLLLGGALTAAQRQGRVGTFVLIPDVSLYASEVLDDRVCAPCRKIDGKWLGSGMAAMINIDRLYPTGGYIDCLGHERCRGQVVAVRPTQENA